MARKDGVDARKGCTFRLVFTGESVEAVSEEMTRLRNISVSEYASQVEREVARARIAATRDLLSRMGLTVTFGLRGKCEIHPMREPTVI